MLKTRKVVLISLLLSLVLLINYSSSNAQTDFFGTGNSGVQGTDLNGPDEQDAGALNQGWDGATGEVVPDDANIDVPDVGEASPVYPDNQDDEIQPEPTDSNPPDYIEPEPADAGTPDYVEPEPTDSNPPDYVEPEPADAGTPDYVEPEPVEE